MKPPAQALALAMRLLGSLPGGISRAEGKALAADALALAGTLAALYAPPVVAPIVGAVLTWAGSALTSPQVTAGDALASLLAVLAGYVPDLDVEAAPVVAPEPPVAGTSRPRPEIVPGITVIETIPVAESAPLADG